MTTRSFIRRSLGRLAAVVALAGAMTAAGAGAAQADEAPVYTFVPIALTVHDTEDGWFDWQDEPHLRYGGSHWYGLVQYGSQEQAIDPVDFTGASMQVDLWERDGWVDNNLLGRGTATPAQLDQELEMTFRGSWWDYVLTYRVVRK